MVNAHICIVDAPDPRVDQLGRNLSAFNDASVGPSDRRALSVLAEGDTDQLMGGLSGYTGWGWLYIQWLWVDTQYRGQGLATDLIARAEVEAKARNCIGAHIDTFSEPARQLYQRLGYQPFGAIPQFVAGETRSFLYKRWS